MEEAYTIPPVDEPLPAATGWRAYHQITRTATYGFLLALPLILFYEVLILFVNRGHTMQVRVGADVWMKQALASVGIASFHVLAVAVVLIGAVIFMMERRRKHIPIRPNYFGWVVLESAVYAVFLAFLVSGVVGVLFASAPVAVPAIAAQLAEMGLFTKLALSIGAGIYEELLFRVILVGGLFAVLKRVLPKQKQAYIIAAVIGALIFSAVHYIGSLGDAFTFSSFTFRFLFGLALNVVFLVRGFGVAAWTHALYDVMVVTGMLG